MAALYRRYRPETFQEVIGQSHVTDPLRHALLAERTHHAYLFSGPRGCGKTTSARILARCLNCQEGPTDTPCGVCPSCVELSRDGGGSLDVVEIDAASHNGVDDARELRERAVFAPARDRFKIYILDEAHMVTQQGFNALLKIVEEPPEHVKFIFATTEPDKVLATIRSRTHHYPFRLVPPGELLSYLESVAESEGVEVEPGVLALVVRSGGGSVRDTLSLLDQLIAGTTGKTISLESAQSLLGYTPRALLDDIVQALSQKDASALFHTLDKVIQAGQDPRRFVEDLLGHLRDVIVIQATGQGGADLFPGVSQSDLDSWLNQASWFSPGVLSQLADTVNDSLSEMSGVTAPKLQLELMMAQLLTKVRGDVGTPSAPPVISAQHVPESAESAPSPKSETPTTPEPPRSQVAQASSEDVSPADSPPAEVSRLEPWTLEALRGVWPAIVESLSQHKRSLWVALSETTPVALDRDVVTIGFVRKSDAEILRKPQGPGSPLPNADLLRDVIEQHTGHRVRFTVGSLEPQEVPAPHVAIAESTWPVVSKPGSDSPEGEVNEPAVEEAPGGARESVVAVESEPVTSPIATRGEPVVRQLLGGELIAEEILEQMSDKGEADV